MPISIFYRVVGDKGEICISTNPAWFNDRADRDKEIGYEKRDFHHLSYDDVCLSLMVTAATYGLLNGQAHGGQLVDFFPGSEFKGNVKILYDAMIAYLSKAPSAN